ISLKQIPEFEKLLADDKKIAADYSNFIKANSKKQRYDYQEILNSKTYFLQQVYEKTSIAKDGKATKELSKFIEKNEWLKAYCVYKNLKWKYMQSSWKEWKAKDKNLSLSEIEERWNDKKLKKEHLFYAWCQLIAANQFKEAVKEIKECGILLKGDMPILMNEDSCDSWAYPQYFMQELRAGSPPDGENPSGQNWGFPIYNWKNLKNDNYSWWKERLKTASAYYDAYRLDHILGFFRIWAIPQDDCNAMNGHTQPYSSIKKDSLYEAGFDDDRIRWLSQPHIPTSVIEDITWNHEAAHLILNKLCEQIGNEELWLFKKSIKGSNQILSTDFDGLCTKEAEEKIKQVLVQYWSNRTLLELSKNNFVPLWTYSNSTSWKSLNQKEKNLLQALFDKLNQKNEKLWQKQAEEIFEAIIKSTKIIPCGEDLGVNIKCVPKVMKKYDILGLRVVRWCRNWSEEGQPFVPFKDYEPLSVATSSVHDSSTLRQWWNDEKESVTAFIKANASAFGIASEVEGEILGKDTAEIEKSAKTLALSNFTPELAQKILGLSAKSASQWFIPPMQDLLYMDKSLWLQNASDERINIPGTVTAFNWTYRMPCTVEEVAANKDLIQKIKKLS
ncbi:MAG: 4-alpha-glucanotransferase, partial [Treponema sp.]|nr:4-alpha-glucanotransferase [Treponema sp.]